jgi:hypothetical protein
MTETPRLALARMLPSRSSSESAVAPQRGGHQGMAVAYGWYSF